MLITFIELNREKFKRFILKKKNCGTLKWRRCWFSTKTLLSFKNTFLRNIFFLSWYFFDEIAAGAVCRKWSQEAALPLSWLFRGFERRQDGLVEHVLQPFLEFKKGTLRTRLFRRSCEAQRNEPRLGPSRLRLSKAFTRKAQAQPSLMPRRWHG